MMKPRNLTSNRDLKPAGRLTGSTALLGTSAFLTSCLSSIAAAQTANAIPETETRLEVILVTAQKREESLQEVPVTVSALNSKQLEETGFDSVTDLAALTPSLQFGNFGPIAFATLRGIGNENTTAGGDPGVALHFDGVYLGRPVGTLFSAFDSERVEVLRGPQGTLYGRNATGGSINYITRKPDDTLSGSADLTVGNYGWIRTRAAANLPIADFARARVVGFFEDRDGFTENPFNTANEGNDADNWGVRGHLAFDVGDSGNLLLSANHISAGGVGSKPELREAYPGTTTNPVTPLGGPPGFAFAPGGPASGIPAGNTYVDADANVVLNNLDPFIQSTDTIQSQDNEFTLLSATFEWDFGPVALKSITAYVETSFRSVQDADHSPLPLSDLTLTESASQFSQELQLVSTNGDKLDWIIGAFFFSEDAERRSAFTNGRFDSIANSLGLTQFAAFDVGGEVETTSIAVFGQATYRLTDSVAFTGGVRFTSDEKDGVNSGQQFPGGPYFDNVEGKWEDVTYRLALDWSVAQDVLLFASYSTGYKSGGINQVVAPSLGAENAIYEPETVRAFEIGLKSLLFDGILQLNASAYRNEYDDLQFQVFGPGGPEAFNASGAVVQGIELEGLFAPTDGLTINVAAAYTDSEFDDQIVSGAQLGGNQVQRTPEWSFNIGATQEFDLGKNGIIRLRGELSYTDEIFYTALNRNGGFGDPGGSDLADDYTNVNLRAFWVSDSEAWTVEFAVTNLFDSVQEGNILRGIGFLDIGGGGGPEEVTYNPPRQYSGRVSFAF